jgi:Domain of unknown function (DUF4360)
VSARKRLALLAVAALAASEAFADGAAHIKGLTFNGSGCPLGGDTILQLLDLDGDGLPEQFGLLFSGDYIAAQGPGVSIVERRRNCNLLVSVALPDGYQFGVAGAYHEGYADLPVGAGGVQRTTYEFVFHSDPVSRETALTGLYTGRYARQDDSGGAGLVWSPCGLDAPLSIRTQVFLEGDASLPAAMSLDYLAPTLIWRRCKPGGAAR